MINLKNSRNIVIVFIAFAIIFFLYSDKIVEYVSTLNPVFVLIISIILNPVYLIFIWALYKEYGLRGAIAGLFIAIASDIISLPHMITSTGEMATASWNLVTETTFLNLMPEQLKSMITLPIIGQASLSVFLIYVFIAISLVILALMIAHKRRFKEIFLKSI